MSTALVEQRGGELAQVEAQQDSGAALLSIIANAARDPHVDVAKMQDLLRMHREMMADQARIAFSRSMKAAQQEMLPVVRDAENKHTGSKYARLEKIDASIRPVYTAHGFSLTFNSPTADKDNATVTCTVLHEQGHSKDYQLSGPLDVAGAQGKSNKTGIQGLGSTVSYLRRYLTAMIFNIVLTNEDNDGSGPVTYISEQQHSSLTDMIAECELTPARMSQFLEYMQVKSLTEIVRSDFPKAMEALRAQLRKKQGGVA